jgi:hypothetical protein
MAHTQYGGTTYAATTLKAWSIGEDMNWIRKALHAIARRVRPSIIDRIAIKVDVDFDRSGMDALNASTADLYARWTDITAMIQAGKPFGIAPVSSVVRLEARAGDALVLSVPTLLRPEQRRLLAESMGAAFGKGPRVIVLDGGATITHVVAAALPPAEERTIVRRSNRAPFKELLDGLETRMSIVAYKLWLKGEGAVCEHDHQPDRFGRPGQYICTYCRDIKNAAPADSAP